MRFLLPAIVLLAGLPSWAAEAVYKAYPGPERPDSEVATLSAPYNGYVVVRDIDPEWSLSPRVDWASYQQVKVLPGQRHITWVAGSGRGEMFRGVCAQETVTLKAGHVYQLAARSRTHDPPPVTSAWIEDTTTNEIIAGRKPPEVLLADQVNPAVTFRWLYDHPTDEAEMLSFYYECIGVIPMPTDPTILERREMLIQLGDQLLASPLRESKRIRTGLMVLAYQLKIVGSDACVGKQDNRKCSIARGYIRHFINKVKKGTEAGELTEQEAADLISNAQVLLAAVGGRGE